MIDQNPLPSRQLRIVAHVTRWILGLVAAFWLLLIAVGVVLHGFIVPRIGEWRGHVERLATQVVGAPVEIGAIAARSEGIFPTIELLRLVVLDEKGRKALELPRVVATLSARSVLRLGLEQLYIDAPVLDVRRLQDGRWQIAGFDLPSHSSTDPDSPALQWLLDQPELALRQGVVHFTDALQGLPAQSFEKVDLVVRRHHWEHTMRLDATPTESPGQHLQAMGVFRLPLLPSSQPQWQRWTGQWYAHTQLHQLPQLPWPSQWGITDAQGAGAVRVWADIKRGQLAEVTTDMALDTANIQWSQTDTPALELHKLQGRVLVQSDAQGWKVEGRNVSFMQNVTGTHWPSSNWAMEVDTPHSQPQRSRLTWDYADVGMASAVAQALPLPASVLAPLAQLQPRGALRDVQLQWTPEHYSAKGRVSDLSVQPQAKDAEVGTPGFQGLTGTFELNEQGGQAQLAMQDGALTFPGVFEVPDIALDRLQAQLRWQVKDGHWQLQVPQASFANSDAQGQLTATWTMGSEPEHRLPGILNLQGTLERAKGTSVHRYLPLHIPAQARHYVRDSVLQGDAEQVRFEVRGDLHHMPFAEPGTGRFYIEAPLRNVTYDFVPASLRSPEHVAWPALQQLAGHLVFEGASMEVRQAKTGFAGHPQVQMASVNARIADLSAPHLMIQAAGHGRLQPMLDFVRQSPLADMTQHALHDAQAQGNASLQLELDLPIDHLHQSRVKGLVGLRDNLLHLQASAPPLHKLQGQVHFSEQGFSLQGVQGQALGGEVTVSGGMASPAAGVHILARGKATAQGLQAARNLPVVPDVARFAEGQAAYEVEIASQHDQHSVVVRSDLRGMALHLPAPLDKTAEQALPLSVAQSLLSEDRQELRVQVAERGSVTYVHDVSVEPAQVVSGRIVLGPEPAPAGLGSADGVSAWVQLPQLDVDAWLALPTSASQESAPTAQAQAYWPQRVHIAIDALKLRQRQIDQVRAQVTHTEGRWRGQLQAQQLGGDVEYLPPSTRHVSGRLFARLDHLSLPKAEAQRMNATPEPQTAPDNLPALDIQVNALTIADKALGRLDLQAHNRAGAHGREWVLEQFDLTAPEARWKASGLWGSPAPHQPRTTQLRFQLDMDNAGKLLERFGMADVIRNGEGKLNGHLGWQGAPITPHWPTMDGGLHMQVGKGQFLKVEPGMGKLLSVLSLQSLTRRINLDFRDVFSQGFAFDFVRGDITVAQGVAFTNNLQMKGLNAAVLMEGHASLGEETQDLRVVVVPEINAMTASLAATAINPVVGLGSFLAQMLFRAPLMEAATRTFHVHGPWADPVVDPVLRNAGAAADESRATP